MGWWGALGKSTEREEGWEEEAGEPVYTCSSLPSCPFSQPCPKGPSGCRETMFRGFPCSLCILHGWIKQDLTSQPLEHHLGPLWAGLDESFIRLLWFSNEKFSSGKRQIATSSPLVSQCWKEVAPKCLVGRPPPQEKQEVRPASGWNVPRAQSWQGVKPSAEYSPGWHRPGDQ